MSKMLQQIDKIVNHIETTIITNTMLGECKGEDYKVTVEEFKCSFDIRCSRCLIFEFTIYIPNKEENFFRVIAHGWNVSRRLEKKNISRDEVYNDIDSVLKMIDIMMGGS